MGASPCRNKAAGAPGANWAQEHCVVASNAHVCFPDILIAPKQGATFQPLGLVGLFLFVFFKFSGWSTILHWWVVVVGSFTSLFYQKPEGSSLCGLGRDFSELEERGKISEERDQSYCHRLQHDMYFLTSNSRLNEQVVDKIILQLNRVYPQILTNAEAEKFRNPRASLHTRLSDLIKHLQKKGDRHCQEFYRALQINAEQLYNDLPSRKILRKALYLPSTNTYQWKTSQFSCLHREAAKLPQLSISHTRTLLNWESLGPSLPQNLG
ncbi:caspase recruitment domain-containing protein 19 isoform X3 [Calonectris borealis]|uniref:uncharacterized protein LOC142077619 isoform X3 n=1 Tax=Calonectris borealis TaxID=1323832 RepID=UPI003F4CA186